jgi:hypothetical protein
LLSSVNDIWSGRPIRAAARDADRFGNVVEGRRPDEIDLALLVHSELEAVILLGLVGGDRPVERIGVAARADLAADQYVLDLALIRPCDLAQEGNGLHEGIGEPLTRIAELFGPVGTAAIVEAADHRGEAMFGRDVEHAAVHRLQVGHRLGLVEERVHRELGQVVTMPILDFGLLTAFGQVEYALTLRCKSSHRNRLPLRTCRLSCGSLYAPHS